MVCRSPKRTKYCRELNVSDKHSFIDEDLDLRKKEQRFRGLNGLTPGENEVAVTKNGKKLVNFCSNDYLGFSKDPAIIERTRRYVQKYGAGSTASRLVSGTYTIHEELEKKIARTFDREAALLFNSGFQANSTIIATLTDRHSLVLADKLSHYSLLQGVLASRADFRRFEHNNPRDLKRFLKEAKEESYDRILIVTETVFSMDGDRSEIEVIAELADQYNALLFVDDAHAVGVWGPEGRGLGYDIPGADILLGTCGKAIGSFGAYVACSQKMKEYLVNFCPGFIYTTGLPPAVVGAVDAAMDMIPNLNAKRNKYHGNIGYLKNSLQELGFDTGSSSTQIIPVIIGDDAETLKLSHWLEEQGILAIAIRPPTVSENSARIRLTLSAAHRREHIDYLLDKLKEWRHGRS